MAKKQNKNILWLEVFKKQPSDKVMLFISIKFFFNIMA